MPSPAALVPTELVVARTGDASPDRVWQLLAQPACWPAWAPHMRHVESRDDAAGAPGAVTTGQRLRIRTVAPGIAVDVEVTDVDAPRSWVMEAALPVGRVRSSHEVTTGPGGVTVTVAMRWLGPRLLGPAVLLPYRPVAAWAVGRLLGIAGAEDAGAVVARLRMCQPEPDA